MELLICIYHFPCIPCTCLPVIIQHIKIEWPYNTLEGEDVESFVGGVVKAFQRRTHGLVLSPLLIVYFSFSKFYFYKLTLH